MLLAAESLAIPGLRFWNRTIRDSRFAIWRAKNQPSSFRRAQEGCRDVLTKALTDGRDNVRGSVDPRFGAGLPFVVPDLQCFKASCDVGNATSLAILLGNP